MSERELTGVLCSKIFGNLALKILVANADERDYICKLQLTPEEKTLFELFFADSEEFKKNNLRYELKGNSLKVYELD